MRREVDMNDISDGKRYGSNDLVKADCGNCEGCHACCCHMGQSIVLDPLDIFRMEQGLGMSFEGLLQKGVELNVADGLILPNLAMKGEEEACSFLDGNGRCSIHAFRPGICRLFPLGRIYENGSFQYFLQTQECKKENRSKIKVKKWLDTPDLKKYEEYINTWHYFLKEQEKIVKENPEQTKAVSMRLLQVFYLNPYQPEEDFYIQFENRMKEM